MVLMQLVDKQLPDRGESGRPDGRAPLARATLQAEHDELLEAVQAVLTLLSEEIGRTSVIARTIQHIQRLVIVLNITHEDHLDSDDALVLPLLRGGIDEGQQLEIERRLLIDDAAENPRWMIDRLLENLSPAEQTPLAHVCSGEREHAEQCADG